MAVKNIQAKKSKYKKVSAYWTHDIRQQIKT